MAIGLYVNADSDMNLGSEACPGVALRSLGGKWLPSSVYLSENTLTDAPRGISAR